MTENILLCVDDEPSVLNVLRQLLQNMDDDVLVEIAESGQEALQLCAELREQGREVSVVLSDFLMPNMRGDEFLIRLHQTSPATIKIMLTGQSDLDGVKRSINEANLYRFIEKPLNNADLVLTVKSALHAYAQERELQQRNEELKASNDGLELVVAARTRELEEKNAQLEKMATLGQLVASVTHEINTPMAAVKSSGGTLSDALTQTLVKLPQVVQKLDTADSDLFWQLVVHANQPIAIQSSRERRAIERKTTEQLEAAGIGDARQRASVLVSLDAQSALAEYLPLLRHAESALILETAHTMGVIISSINNINTAVDRAAKIILALKSFSRVNHSAEKIDADLSEGIETVLTIHQGKIKEGVEVIRHYDAIPLVRCLPDELNQVWTNLIHNALQAMEYKGTLTVGIRRDRDDAVVSIGDSGCGIPDEIRSKIFDVFFTTKPAGVGSGLGLDIVKKIIDKHRGRIEVRSEVGVGTTFTVILPLQPTEGPSLKSVPDSSDQVAFSPEDSLPVGIAAKNDTPPWQVLVVDDEPVVHAGTEFALGNFAFQGRQIEFFNAHSGAEARMILDREPDLALAFIDVVMETPHCGLNLVRYIREELGNKSIRLVLRTGQPGQSSEDLITARYEIDGYVRKVDLTVETLRAVIISNLRTYANTASLINAAAG